MNWVAEELWDVDLGDARGNRRLVKDRGRLSGAAERKCAASEPR
jgi:hypothetical protein